MTAHYSETDNTMNTFSLFKGSIHKYKWDIYSPIGFPYLPNTWRGAYTLSSLFGGSVLNYNNPEMSIWAPIGTISVMECPNFRIPSEGNFYATSMWIDLNHGANLSLTRYDWRDTGQRKFAQMGGHWFYTTKVPDHWRVRARVAVLEGALEKLLKLRKNCEGDIGWRGKPEAIVDYIRVKHILLIEAALSHASEVKEGK